jgi:hypothetical protein
VTRYPGIGAAEAIAPSRDWRRGLYSSKGDQMASKSKKVEKPATDPKVVYLNLPGLIAGDLAKDAEENMRPISVHAAWIIKQYFDAKKNPK